MAKRLLQLVILLAIIGLAYIVYTRWVAARNNTDTAGVQLLGDPDSNSKVVVDKNDLNNLRNQAENAVKPATSTTTVTTQTTAPTAPATTTYAVPATDTIPANPTNGMVFAGTGRYQLYRQGSITWRLDTDSGRTCIIFATDEQWHLQRVYSHGCGNE
jgi:hypothetical protein